MSKTSRCLGRSLVRRLCSRSTICLAVLTFCAYSSFADDFEPKKLLIRTWSSFGVESGSVASLNAPVLNVSSEDEIFSVLNTSTVGICLNTLRRDYNYGVVVPSFSTNVLFSTSYNVMSITNSVRGLLGGSTCVASVGRFPRVRSLFQSTASLYWNGYRGSGFRDIFDGGDKICINVDYPLLYADVLSSTNTVFRQILLSHISNIQSSVQNIEVNLSGLQSAISEGHDISSNILSSVDSVNTNLVLGFDVLSTSLSSVGSNSLDVVRSVDTLVSLYKAENPLSVVAISNLIDDAFSSSLISDPKYRDWLSKLSEFSDHYYDSDVGQRQLFYDEVFSTLRAVNSSAGFFQGLYNSLLRDSVTRDALRDAGAYFNSDVVDALIGDYSESRGGSKAVNVRSSIKSQLQGWRNEATQQLQDWKADLKSDLQSWKTSDETGYLNIRQTIDDNFNRNFTTPDRASTNRLPFTAYVTNYVTRIVTNSIEQSSADIQSNATSNVDRQIQGDEDRWNEFKRITTGNGEGLNVKVKFPLWESDGYHVNVRDDGVIQAIQDGITIVNPDLTDIRDSWDSFMEMYSPTNSLDWDPWFEKWVPFSEIVTNYYGEFNASVPASEIAADFLECGFDSARYSALPWFERVEVLLAMIADVRSNSVEVADIQEDMERQVENFQGLSTNVVAVSSDVVGLFGYVQRFSSSLQSIFGDRAAPLTGDYVLLSAGHWIGDQPLVLRINPTIQNLCRLIMQCIWYLGFLVLLWVVVNWCWQKVVAVLRWLWSMFDV